MVTLLLKSGFKGIEISAVEGFVPDDDGIVEMTLLVRLRKFVENEGRKSH